MYTISRSIYYTILNIQIFCESLQSVNLVYTISIKFMQFRIFKFYANADNPYIKCTTFPVKFTQFWIFKFYANPNNPYT